MALVVLIVAALPREEILEVKKTQLDLLQDLIVVVGVRLVLQGEHGEFEASLLGHVDKLGLVA